MCSDCSTVFLFLLSFIGRFRLFSNCKPMLEGGDSDGLESRTFPPTSDGVNLLKAPWSVFVGPGPKWASAPVPVRGPWLWFLFPFSPCPRSLCFPSHLILSQDLSLPLSIVFFVVSRSVELVKGNTPIFTKSAVERTNVCFQI